MAIRPIIVAPDPRLKVKCAPVERVDDAVRALMQDLLDTMYQAPGVGLAAPQVGVARRVIVVDTAPKDQPRTPLRMANPEIVWKSEDLAIYEEGCLSFPEQYSEVKRPARVRVRFLDEHDEMREIDIDGLQATCVQHEMDHLDGVLFVDHISTLKRGIILRKMQKAKRAEARAGF
jgi:peptide deformylase